MKYTGYIALIALGVLAGCAGRQQAANVTDASPASKAVSAELAKATLPQFDRCFKVLNRSERSATYEVFRDKVKNQSCAAMVARSSDSVLAELGPAIVAFNIDPEQCDMRALRCINPAAARKIAGKYRIGMSQK